MSQAPSAAGLFCVILESEKKGSKEDFATRFLLHGPALIHQHVSTSSTFTGTIPHTFLHPTPSFVHYVSSAHRH